MENDQQPGEARLYRCLDCRAGVRRLRYLTYFTWFRDQLITEPQFPAWVCDICGEREYDRRAISWLNTLLRSQRRPGSGGRIAAP